jgi:amino acid permease
MSSHPSSTEGDTKEKGYGDLSNVHTGPHEGDIITHHNVERPPLLTRLGLTADSFKKRTLDDEHNQLNKTLKSRHLNMIAIGGSIGAGLFVGSGGALSTGGPAALLIGMRKISDEAERWFQYQADRLAQASESSA